MMDPETAAKLAEGFDVTSRIMETLEWMVTSELQRKIQAALEANDPVMPTICLTCEGPRCPEFDECVACLNLSPKMRTAVALLADLQSGHVRCIRDRQTQDH